MVEFGDPQFLGTACPPPPLPRATQTAPLPLLSLSFPSSNRFFPLIFASVVRLRHLARVKDK